MLKLAVLVSGGGTNLQAIMDAIDHKAITNAEIKVVISNNKNAYALERAKNHGITGVAIAKKQMTQEAFEEALNRYLKDYQIDFIILAGFLSILSETVSLPAFFFL